MAGATPVGDEGGELTSPTLDLISAPVEGRREGDRAPPRGGDALGGLSSHDMNEFVR